MASYCHYSPMLKHTERSIGNAVLKANIDGSFHLLLGLADIGQGLRTIMAQICAEALGGKLDEIDETLADTSVTPWGTTTAASRSTIETGGAVKEAADEMGVSVRTVYEYRRRGWLAASRIGRTVRIDPQDVERLMDAGRRLERARFDKPGTD